MLWLYHSRIYRPLVLSGEHIISTGTTNFLSQLTWHEARELLTPRTVALLPTGAIEAHGPHLPLDTDVIIARETSRRAAALLARRGDTAVILPHLAYGVSYVGTCFPGTMPLPANVHAEVVANVLISIAKQGPTRLAIVNAHLEPAHVTALATGAATAHRETGAVIALPDQREERWAATLSDEFRRGARHAGSYETSLMLAATPHAVRRDVLPHLEPVWVDLPARLNEGARSFAEAGGTDGYFGDPARASAAEGERLFDALARMVVTTLDEATGTPSSG